MRVEHVREHLEYLRDEWAAYFVGGDARALEDALRSLSRSEERGRVVLYRDGRKPEAIENAWGFYIDDMRPLQLKVSPGSRGLKAGDTVDVYGKFAWATEGRSDVREGDLVVANLVARLWTGTRTEDGDPDLNVVRDHEADEWTAPGSPAFPPRRVLVKWHLDFAPEHAAEPCYHATFGGAARDGERALYQEEIPWLPRIPTTPFDFTLGLEIVAANFLGDTYREGKGRDVLWSIARARSEEDLLKPYLRRSTRWLEDEPGRSHYELWEGRLPR